MSFAESLTSHTIDTPNDPRFDKVYDCYSKVFTLPSERESRENFEAILESNAEAEVQAGKSKELWVYLQDEKGNVVGAANFDVFAGSKAEGYDGTVHAIYVFVDPAYRQKGVFTRLNDEMHRAACEYIKEAMPEKTSQGELNVPILAEQNAPLRMTPEEYMADNEAAGIDQVQRRVVFENEGYRTLDCRYIQPPLSADQEACTYLDMVARPGRAGEKTIPSSVIKEHLDRFFTLSFPEGTTRDSAELAEMNQSLEKSEVALQPAGRFKNLRDQLNADMVTALPEAQQETPLGELKPELRGILRGDARPIELPYLDPRVTGTAVPVTRVTSPLHCDVGLKGGEAERAGVSRV